VIYLYVVLFILVQFILIFRHSTLFVLNSRLGVMFLLFIIAYSLQLVLTKWDRNVDSTHKLVEFIASKSKKIKTRTFYLILK
jgi:hypothetical protein